MTSHWLDAQSAAALLSVSTRTFRERWALLPGFPAPMRVGGVGRPRWRQDELLEWAERQRPEKVEAAPAAPEPMSSAPEYNTWKKMHDRCRNPNATQYRWYGGRGIKVCERWNDFRAFISDMGPRPSPEHSVDRIDNYRGYEPENCRWATREQQYANRRCPRCDHAAHRRVRP